MKNLERSVDDMTDFRIQNTFSSLAATLFGRKAYF
jgi:hypothetical protein